MVWLLSTFFAVRNDSSAQGAAIGILGKQIEALQTAGQTNKDVIAQSLTNTHNSLTQSLTASQGVMAKLNQQLGNLQSSNQQMLSLAGEIKRLQTILTSPKLRGQLGEWSLKNLLETVLPADAFSLQHTLKNGKIVDAMVKMNGFNVPIDAKFPLPAFEKLSAAENEDDRLRLRKQFLRDVTTHVDKISASYIRPAEGTLDFALMYIPAENVYYETIIKFDGDSKDILNLALEKKVIPVSPNLLYAYLMTVVMGLHGMQIEKQAAEIRQNLKKLNTDFSDFVINFETLGGHIRKSTNKYDEANTKLSRFSLQLETIQDSPVKEIGELP
jgi:DNA recombination protein RmuC